MKIVDFRAKVNDEFRANEGGHFLVNNYKRDGMWIFEIPQLKLKNKDQLYYWMRLALSKEAFDVVVKGVVEITSEYVLFTLYYPILYYRANQKELCRKKRLVRLFSWFKMADCYTSMVRAGV